MIFVSAQVIITSITALGMFTNLCLVLPLLLASSLVPKFHFQLKKKTARWRSGKCSNTVQMTGRWRDSFSSALCFVLLCGKSVSFEGIIPICLLADDLIASFQKFVTFGIFQYESWVRKVMNWLINMQNKNVLVEKVNQFGYNLTEILHMKILISTWVAMSK